MGKDDSNLASMIFVNKIESFRLWNMIRDATGLRAQNGFQTQFNFVDPVATRKETLNSKENNKALTKKSAKLQLKT